MRFILWTRRSGFLWQPFGPYLPGNAAVVSTRPCPVRVCVHAQVRLLDECGEDALFKDVPECLVTYPGGIERRTDPAHRRLLGTD